MIPRIASVALLVTLCGGGPALAQQSGGLSPIQVARLRIVRSVHPSPDGRWIAFVRSEPRLAGAKTPGSDYSNLFIVPVGGGPERLLIGGDRSVRGVAWRPDGKAITFLDRRAGDAHDEVYALPMNGGEPVRITRTPRGVSSYKWQPGGEALVVAMRDDLPRRRKMALAMGFRQSIVDEGWTHTCLYLWDLVQQRLRRLTEGSTVLSYEWAPDGSKLAVGLAPRPLVDDSYMFVRLHVIDLARGGEVRKLVENPGKLGSYAWSPSGARLAYIAAADRNDPHAGMLFVLDAANGSSRAVLPGFKGMFLHVEWVDDRVVLAAVDRGVHSQLVLVDTVSGKIGDPLASGVALHSFARDSSGTVICAAASTARHPAEVFQLIDRKWQRLTRSNRWLDKASLGQQSVLSFEARDGLSIEGLLIYPVGYRKGQRYPLVIVVHGGPEAHFSNGWNTSYSRWGQLLAARGYFAWYPNYRSSTGYGVEFAKKDHGDPMGAEFEDHLDAIALLDSKGLIDRARVGIGGGSYGGYTSAWAATRWSEHFAAAVAFVPFTDIRTKWYTTDIPWEFYYVHYQEKWPHQQQEFLASRSPLTFAPRCRTPLLILGGSADPRVNPSQPFMLFRAVKTATKTPVRYVRYPGEGHGNRINVYRYDYCVRTLRWFDHYLAPGARRKAAPPPIDLDYSAWAATRVGAR